MLKKNHSIFFSVQFLFKSYTELPESILMRNIPALYQIIFIRKTLHSNNTVINRTVLLKGAVIKQIKLIIYYFKKSSLIILI